SGEVGCGWAIYCVGGGQQRLVVKGSCYLGDRAEVFDAELHAVHESLLALGEINKPPGRTYLCIDNTAAIDTLSSNSRNSMYARHTLECAATMVGAGWLFTSVWTPSHLGIQGNEVADCLANQGTQKGTNEKCTSACTTKAWLYAEARRRFNKNWLSNIPAARADIRA